MYFLPVVLALYYLLPTLRIRNILLIAVSLLFYAYGEPVYVLLMIASIIINYIFGRLLGNGKIKRNDNGFLPLRWLSILVCWWYLSIWI